MVPYQNLLVYIRLCAMLILSFMAISMKPDDPGIFKKYMIFHKHPIV